MTWAGRIVTLFAALVAFLLAVVAVNQTEVALRFLAWQTPELSVFWWLLGAFCLGLALGLAWLGVAAMRARLERRRLTRELEACRKALNDLKAGTSP
jgi:uncharacterized integral membrane protein